MRISQPKCGVLLSCQAGVANGENMIVTLRLDKSDSKDNHTHMCVQFSSGRVNQ